MTKTQKSNGWFLAYFDSLGFECIYDLKAYERDQFISALKGSEPTLKLPLNMMIIRAQANPQRFPEIWTFTTEEGISKEDIEDMASESPQALADLIRKNGNPVYVAQKQKTVIV